MIEIRTDVTVYYIDDNGKKAILHRMGKSKSECLELAEDMAKTMEVTRVRIKAQTFDDKKPKGYTTSWYDMKDGKPEIIYSEMR